MRKAQLLASLLAMTVPSGCGDAPSKPTSQVSGTQGTVPPKPAKLCAVAAQAEPCLLFFVKTVSHAPAGNALAVVETNTARYFLGRGAEETGDLASHIGQYVWGSVTDRSAVVLEFYFKGDDYMGGAQPWRIIKIEAKD